MARDDSKLAYYSGWDIDQLVATDTVNVNSGTSFICSLPQLTSLFRLQFQPAGQTVWYDEGLNSTDGTFANTFLFYSKSLGTSLYSVTASGGKVRYFIWSDKVNY